ncbi:uncharacterized protein EV422DRAFT_525852 [Fimicolochytrium jonesii]|uniref:uncharacterized protein n=1 Tax=Fimicolochytrium jonesii TaxID=1396493 RepID=UPI0022FEFA10|nr:uncharacterized protein EV422DRAFT_525852 [Fimicolochytrium jonesii]KAI8822145.1 hypothetical protein EV422DRAFT_525852 [Fimicolochytrium jonesii]
MPLAPLVVELTITCKAMTAATSPPVNLDVGEDQNGTRQRKKRFLERQATRKSPSVFERFGIREYGMVLRSPLRRSGQ